jgi:hypothetical protein
MLSHPHKRKTEFGLSSLLFQVQSDQTPPYPVRDESSGYCIDQCRPDQIARNGVGLPIETEGNEGERPTRLIQCALQVRQLDQGGDVKPDSHRVK